MVLKTEQYGHNATSIFLVLPHFLLTVGGVLSCSYAFLLCLFNFEEMPSFKKSIYMSLVLSLDFAFLTYYYGTFQPLSLILTAIFSLVLIAFSYLS